MPTRRVLLGEAIDNCLEELYTLVQPEVTWTNFEMECDIYSKNYKVWENFNDAFHNREKDPQLWEQYKVSFPNWENKSMRECIGPRPYEFYYLPKEIMKDVCESYVYAYKLDEKQEFLDTINILKEYCKNPIVDKWIEGPLYLDGTQAPGHRGYEHPDNLEKELSQTLKEYFNDSESDPNAVAKELQNKFFEFLDMAGNFFDWNGDLNTFNMSVYLGPSPNSNKEAVIENWKKYRNKDIEIDESKYDNEYEEYE